MNNGVTSDDWMLTKKEKKKRKEEAAAVAAANVSMDLQNNLKEKKKAKKRKLEKENGENCIETKIDWAQEVDQVLPLNGDSAKKKKKKEGDEPEKKKKKKEKAQHLETSSTEEASEEIQEKGAFKKIFYRPTKATLSTPKEQVEAFQEKHKMNLTGNAVHDHQQHIIDPLFRSALRDLQAYRKLCRLLHGPKNHECRQRL